MCFVPIWGDTSAANHCENWATCGKYPPPQAATDMNSAIQVVGGTGTTRAFQASSDLIVADGLCSQIAELLPGALHEIVALGASANPLAAITQELLRKRQTGQPLDTLHIVAHGRPGALQIGGRWVARRR